MAYSEANENITLGIDKKNLIEIITNTNDLNLLIKIQSLIGESETTEVVSLYDDYLQELLYQGDDAGEPCQTHIKTLPNNLKVDRYENKAASPIFALSLIMLVLAGSIILLLTGGREMGQFAFVSGVLFNIYWVIWLLFVVDFFLVIYFAVKESTIIHKGELIFRACSLFFPPLRIGSRRITDSNFIWLPIWGWSKANYALFDRLRREFSFPMIIIALFILPVLIVEWKFYDQVVNAYPDFPLDLWMQLVQAFIWIAFTFEFILMFSVTNEKIDYCKRNWIDILIIFLPLISFFRTLRLIRLARLNHLARGYKLRGILMKAKQGLVIADAFQRIIYPNPKIHVRSLHKQLSKNKREREEINRQILVAVERLKKNSNKNKRNK
ncbi:hypothetical protein BH23BAC1_BH23BAC1_45300 [soil metagenome]